MLTLVTPAYNEALNLRAIHGRIVAAMDAIGESWEWIVIDDHSGDQTFAVVRELAGTDGRVRGIRLARNEGSHIAITAGLHAANGEAAIVLAADLQDPPETVTAMLALWREGAQVVWASRRQRPGERAHAGFAAVYYWVMRRVVGLTTIPERGADFFLVDRAVLDAFARYAERQVSVFALIAWMGFRQGTVEYDKQPRAAGQSGWTLTKKIALVADSVTAFSALPLRIVMAAGALLLAAGAAGLVLWALRGGERLGLVAAIAAIGGLQVAATGVVGEYLWRTLELARRRPVYLIEAVAGEPAGSADGKIVTIP
ncbi:MAG: glycosyltransferase family 2 protein [Vicinamibacterales bacterium]